MSNEMDEGTNFIAGSAVADLVAMIEALPKPELDASLQVTFIFEGKRDLDWEVVDLGALEWPTFDWHVGQDGSPNTKYVIPTEK